MNSDSIVAWERDAPQWPDLLAAARGDAAVAAVENSLLWRIYGPVAAAGSSETPRVIAQMGQSLDGRTATQTGHSHYINGPSAILHLHRLRALVDAVVIGVGTAIADDPQLTVRHVTGPQPARVIIDPRGRLPQYARCLFSDGARRIIVGPTAPSGIEHLPLHPRAQGIDPADIVTGLASLGLKRILIEGGGQTVSRFLEAKVLDRLHVMVAPILIGAGPVGLSFGAIADLAHAARPAVVTYQLPHGDMLFDCAFN